MSGLVKGLLRVVGWRDAGRHKLPEGKSETAVEVLVEQVAHPAAFKFGSGKEPVWNPKEYRFNITQGPTGFARVRHYWNAHWRAVAKQFLHPIVDFYQFVQWVRTPRQPKNRVAAVFNARVEKEKAVEDRTKIVNETAEKYGPVIARLLEKEFLQGQETACELLSNIIIYRSVHAMEKKRATKLFRVALTPDYLEERLDMLLPVLTKTMHMKPFITAQGRQSIGWQEHVVNKDNKKELFLPHEWFGRTYGHDPLAFREKTVILIVKYLTTIVPIAKDLDKNGKDQGALREKLEEHDLLAKQTLTQCLTACLPKARPRCKTREEELLLEGLCDVFVEYEDEVNDSVDELLKKLVGSRALDSYFASALKLGKGEKEDLPPAKKPKKEKDDVFKGNTNVLTDAESDAIYHLEATMVGVFSRGFFGSKLLKWVGKAAFLLDYYLYGFVGRALGRLIEHDNIEYRMCSLKLTKLLPALREAAKKAEAGKESKTDYTKVVDEYFENNGLKVVKKLRKLLHRYPLLLDNLMRLVIRDAIEYFLVDPIVESK